MADYPTPRSGTWTARDFRFHTGEMLPEVRLAYKTVGNPDGEPVLRHAWLAEARPGSTFTPTVPDEVREVRFVPKPEFDALYGAGLIRMHHTKLFYEDALRERGRRGATPTG